MFKPHIQDVTATAIIKGLAVTKYNRAASKWEVVFLRNCGHHPKLTIRKIDRESGRILSIIKTHNIAPGDNLAITVSSPENLPWRYVTREPFSRNPGHDAQDFRWMLDIQALHGREVARTGGAETNSLSIANGCFYTSVRTKKRYQKKWIPPQGEPVKQKLGLTGSMVGSDFKGASVVVALAGNTGFPITLDHDRNSRYEIIFDNTCVDEDHPAPGQTDFQLYYRLFDGSHGRVEILPDDNLTGTAEGGGGSVSDSPESSSNSEGGENQPPDDEPDPATIPKEPPCHVLDDGDTGD